eukprot:2278360-Alexandrium_andersonii.AAC.1
MLARRRDPALWPGALAQVPWAGAASPEEVPSLLLAHNCRAGPFQALLQDMAGMGISSPAAMLDYMARRAESATLEALQPSGRSDLWAGCQVPPCMLAPLVNGWQEQLCEA